jgi:hypothetical protein
VIAVLVASLLAQTDPTPFWMPPPPEKKKQAPPKKKKKPPPVQVAPIEITAKPAPKPPPEQPTWIEAQPASPEKRTPAEPVTQVPPAAATAPVRQPVAPAPAPPPVVPPPEAATVPKPIAPPPQPVAPQVPAPVAVEPEPEPEPVAHDIRRWTVDALIGGWGAPRSDGSGRAWDLAYGLRGGYAVLDSLELELQLARSAQTAGSPFVSASTARNLIAARLFYVLGDRYALLLGGGGGIVLSQTHYSLLTSTDPGAAPTGLDATAVKGVIEITAAGRARIWRGLEARAEVSTLLRDGRLEILPLFAVGVAF